MLNEVALMKRSVQYLYPDGALHVFMDSQEYSQYMIEGDAIEDELIIAGVAYRFIDTAGIRHTEDFVENIGIQKTFENIEKAQLVLHLIDSSKIDTLQHKISELNKATN